MMSGGGGDLTRSALNVAQICKAEARGCRLRVKAGVIYVFNWVRALSSYSWGTIR